MVNDTHPTISVIIPAYNCARYLAQAVESVLAQTCPPTELIVVDDGSTDDTPQVMEHLRAAVSASASEQIPLAGARSYIRNDISLRMIRQPNGGPADARNTGVQAARGEWIAFLDGDDVWFPDKLERQIAVLKPGGLLCGEVLVFTGMNLPTAPVAQPATITELLFERLIQLNRIATSTVVVPRAALLEVGGFNNRYRGPEDFDCWLNLAAHGVPVRKMTTTVAGYRIIPQSLSQQVELMREQELEIVDHWSRIKGKILGRRFCRQARAAVYYRAGVGFTEAQQPCAAIGSVLRSVAFAPGRLPEYSRVKSWPRLRLLARCFLSRSTVSSL